jgi:hypothetical protein
MATHKAEAERILGRHTAAGHDTIALGILSAVLAVVDKLDEQPKEGVRVWIGDEDAVAAAEMAETERRLDREYGTEDSPETWERDSTGSALGRVDYERRARGGRLRAARGRTGTRGNPDAFGAGDFRETSFNRGVEAAAADLKQRLAQWVQSERDDNHVILKIYEWIASMEKKDE